MPGRLTAGPLPHIGELWAFLATEMHFDFVAPVHIGDTITAETEVAEREHGLSLRTPAAGHWHRQGTDTSTMLSTSFHEKVQKFVEIRGRFSERMNGYSLITG